jgi:hypothetical protein
MYTLWTLRTLAWRDAWIPALSLFGTLVALFSNSAVSIQAFFLGLVINAINIATVFRVAAIETTTFGLQFQLSLVYSPGVSAE